VFRGEGSKSTKNIGIGVLVCLWMTLDTCLTENPISLSAYVMSVVEVVEWRLRITILKALSSLAWYVWYSALLFLRISITLR